MKTKNHGDGDDDEEEDGQDDDVPTERHLPTISVDLRPRRNV